MLADLLGGSQYDDERDKRMELAPLLCASNAADMEDGTVMKMCLTQLDGRSSEVDFERGGDRKI